MIMEFKRPRSFLEKLGGGISGAIKAGGEEYDKYKQKNLEKQGLEQFEKLTGVDIQGLSPELQKAFGTEILKQQGKGQRQGQTQSFLDQLFNGGNSQQNQLDQDMGSSQGNQQQGQFNPVDLTDAQIAQVTAMDPNVGRSLQHAKDVGLREKREEEKLEFEKSKLRRKEETAISTPILTELNQLRKNIPLQEQSILDIQEASAAVSPLDYFADVTGFEPARSEKGAKFKTAIKDFFLSDLSRVGARPNMWVEQQLLDALPKIGRSKEANLVTAEGMKFKVNLAKKRMELIDQLSEQDREKYGYVKADIDTRASKEMKKFVIDQQKILQDNIKKIKSAQKGKKDVLKVRSPDGSVYEIESSDLDEARENGFELTE